MTFGEAVLSFNDQLRLDIPLQEGIEAMNPFREPEAQKVTSTFYHKFYNDNNPRVFLFGINPGRFGAGITGVCFTDPIRLETVLGIPNNFPKKMELSSVLIYDIIAAYGGSLQFYSDFYITAVSPLGFIRNGLNMNYYDDKGLQKSLKPFIIENIQKQLEFGAERDVCICIGEGKNYDYLDKLNKEYAFFNDIIPLPHPRFIMQYRQRRRAEYVNMYIQALRQAIQG